MATSTKEPNSQMNWQRRFVLLAAILFPLLVAGGVLAPQVISVIADVEQPGESPEEEDTPVLNFTEPLPGKPPLPLPRDYNMGFVPELLDLHNLFRRSSYSSDPVARQYARLLGFPRSHGDVIVMDDVDTQIRNVLFEDPVMVGAITDEIGPPDPDLLVLGDPIPHGDGLRFDDPQPSGEGDIAQVTPIPEPNTALLLMAGLAAVSMGRRR